MGVSTSNRMEAIYTHVFISILFILFVYPYYYLLILYAI